MKKSRFTETQIVKALKENEANRKVEDFSWKLGMSTGIFYQWPKKYGGMEDSHLRQLKEL